MRLERKLALSLQIDIRVRIVILSWSPLSFNAESFLFIFEITYLLNAASYEVNLAKKFLIFRC